ncbi:pseudouridine synthase [Actinomycetaceae bacterium L2_0104]
MARPVRLGIGARQLRVTLSGEAFPAVGQLLPHRISDLEEAFGRGDILDDVGGVLSPTSPLRAGQKIWAFDTVPDEPDAPIVLDIVAQTDRWIIVDKPHGLATMPRGSHVARTATVAARRQFVNDDVVAAHRLDALTAGLLLLTTEPRWRGVYQQLFEQRKVRKEYRAVVDTSGTHWHERLTAYADPGNRAETGALTFPREYRVELHLDKPRGSLQTLVRPGETHRPNSVTDIEILGADAHRGYLLLRPYTGKTHQLRVTCAHLGMPILGDPLYPQVADHTDLSLEDPRRGGIPLQLLAESLDFVDPIDGQHVSVHSRQALDLWDRDY